MSVALLTENTPKPWLNIYCNSVNQLSPPPIVGTSLTLSAPGTVTTPGTITAGSLNVPTAIIGALTGNTISTTGAISAPVVNPTTINSTAINNSGTLTTATLIGTSSTVATMSGNTISLTGIATTTGILVKPIGPFGPTGSFPVAIIDSGQNIGITSAAGPITISLPAPNSGFKIKFTFTAIFNLSETITWTTGAANMIGLLSYGSLTNSIFGGALTLPGTPVTNVILTTAPNTVIVRGDYVKFWCVDSTTMYFKISSSGYPNTSWATS